VNLAAATGPLYRLPIGDVVDQFIDYITDAWAGLFAFIKNVLIGAYKQLVGILTNPGGYESVVDAFKDPAFWGLVVIFGLIGWALGNWISGLSTFVGFGALYLVFDFVLTPQMNRLKPFGLEGYPSFGEVLPVLIVIVALTLIAYAASGWLMSLVTVLGLVLIYIMNQWDLAMGTLSLVIIASVLAVIIAVPIGILAAKSRIASVIIRPVLDFMQTMPAFVYLIPAVVIFRTGPTVGIIATLIFSMAPGVRFTELGIRQVDKEVVEAGHAFGSSPARILRQIEMPLALPTIMAGINQVIMLALSMVVIAGMVGAGGLGKDVVSALSRVDVSLGFEAGLAVVILAIYLDRITSGLSNRSAVARANKAR